MSSDRVEVDIAMGRGGGLIGFTRNSWPKHRDASWINVIPFKWNFRIEVERKKIDDDRDSAFNYRFRGRGGGRSG